MSRSPREIASLADVNAAIALGRSVREYLQQVSNKVVLYFWAAWCEPCSHMDVVIIELSKQHPDVAFCRVEAEVVDEVTIKYNVATVPAFVFLQGGSVVGTLEGADPPALTAMVTKLEAGGLSASAAPASAATGLAAAEAAPPATSNIVARIKYLLASSPVVLFMKGDAEAPRCGFSRTVVDELKKLNAPLHCVDILQDEEMRAAVKEFGQWPTYPQLYVKGELVGGCDIIKEMAANGELLQLLKDKLGVDYAKAQAAHGRHTMQAAQALAKPVAPVAANPVADESREATIARIDDLLARSDVLLFMKGTPAEPRCGFSRKVCDALAKEGISFGTFDILGDEAVRQTLKEYKEWPTYPQLYAKGELVGGCDIVLEMAAAGELKGVLQTVPQ